uniref:Uncharacterized protein n=1 Tax=Parastrongyloides trichosuri TaxID=131310 RepID=A0A0N4Z4J2_PARTI
MKIYFELLIIIIIINVTITKGEWPSWDPDVVVINKPNTVPSGGVYRRIKYGYYTFPSNSQWPQPPPTWPSPPPTSWPSPPPPSWPAPPPPSWPSPSPPSWPAPPPPSWPSPPHYSWPSPSWNSNNNWK